MFAKTILEDAPDSSRTSNLLKLSKISESEVYDSFAAPSSSTETAPILVFFIESSSKYALYFIDPVGGVTPVILIVKVLPADDPVEIIAEPLPETVAA